MTKSRYQSMKRHALAVTLCVAVLLMPTKSQAVLKIACVGDSITAGAGVQPQEAYPVVLQNRLGNGYVVTNLGVSGRCVQRAADYPYSNEPQAVTATNWLPDIIVFMLGSNDGKPYNWTNTATFTNDLQWLVQTFAAGPSHPRMFICSSCPVFPGSTNFAIDSNIVNNLIIPAQKQCAALDKFPLIDVNARMSGHPEWFAESVHPNAAGYAQIADVVYQSIIGSHCGPIVPAQLRINCGTTAPYMQEQYLNPNNGSVAGTTTICDFTNTAIRTANNSSYFGYHIPIDSNTLAPLYLSFYGKGQIKATVEGTVLLNATMGYTGFAPFEYKLTNSAVWADGFVDIRFDDAVTSDSGGPSIAWLELWDSSEWQERIKHILWDTSAILWNVGSYDAFGNEFRGNTSDFVTGNDFSTLTNSGTIYLRWNQSIAAGKQYCLLAGVTRGSTNFSIDMGNNGSPEYVSSNTTIYASNRLIVADVDITSQIAASNVVKLTLADGVLDFAALVEVTPGSTPDETLRVSFRGNEMADNWTKLVNSTMFFSGHLYEDWSSGEFLTSSPHGAFTWWFGVDSANQTLELTKWGCTAQAKQGTYYLRNMYASDSGASAFMAADIAYLMMMENYSGTYTTGMYAYLKSFCDTYSSDIETDPRHLSHETNWENGGPNHTAYDNTAIYPALLFGAQVATKLGNSADATRWQNAAASQLSAINTYLILPSQTVAGGDTLPAGTFRYSLDANGVDPGTNFAGMWSAGNHEEAFFGYRGNSSTLAPWRAAMDKMLDYHPSTNFTINWRRYGDNYGVGTRYGALSEMGGRMLTSMLLSDRLDLYQKNLMHVIWNSCDNNFPAPFEGTYGEISPWVLPENIDAQDNLGGIARNGWNAEDMNGAEYAECMKNARVMAGVDDLLYNGDSLVIIPRLPVSWNEVKVNQWPVAYRTGGNIGKGDVTFDFYNEPTNGSIDISASATMTGVKFRFGPFEKSSSVASVSTNGTSASYTTEIRGSARWVWVTTDIGMDVEHIDVTLSPGSLVVCDSFNSGTLSGWSPNGGTWSNTGTQAKIVTAGNARDMASAVIVGDSTVAADIKIESASLSTSSAMVGISMFANSNGTSGYTLVADFNTGKVKLLKDSTVLASDDINLKPNRTYRLKMTDSGSTLDCYLDEVKVIGASDSTYTSGMSGLFASNGTAYFDNVTVLQTQAPQDWTAYNDCAWHQDPNIFPASPGVELNAVNYSTNSLWGATNGTLISSNGAALSAQVTFSGAAVTMLARNVNLPGIGSDLDTVFTGHIGTNNAMNWTNGTVTLTVSGLNSNKQYSMAIWSSRGNTSAAYSNRWTDIAISSIDSFTNNSSTGLTKFTGSAANDSTRVVSALDGGRLARYDAIRPGVDGTIVFNLTANGLGVGDTNGYLNAFMLQESPAAAVTNTHTNAITTDWVAYNDTAWTTMTNANIPIGDPSSGLFSTNSPWTIKSGNLIDATSGTQLAAQVSFAGSVACILLDRTFAIPAGSDAESVFAGHIGTNCVANWSGGNVIMTVSGLDSTRQYNVVLWSTRGTDGTPYSNRFTDITISGADAFVNDSSSGVQLLTNSVANDGTRMRSPMIGGHVARYDNVSPGSDGIVTFTLKADADATWSNGAYGTNGYLNGFMIQTVATTNDTIPDSWKIQYFGSTNATNGGTFEDFDHDGFSNYEEWRSGTDPTNANSLLEFTSAANTATQNTQVVISWTGVNGKNYSLLTTTNLVSSWSALLTGIPGVSPMNVVTVNVINPRAYWRVKVE